MNAREYCFTQGIFPSVRLSVPVISVGNLTMGGTGKTPMVKYIARLLQDQGYSPAIISRGYGGATKERINIVSDGSNLLLDADYVGDEPRMLAESLSGVQVLTGVVRRLPAAHAVEMGADVVILDDGFQHLAINRNLDLVLFNGDTLAGNSRVFPGGDLREPVKALNRCHGFVITQVTKNNRERVEKFADLLRKKFSDTPVFFNGYEVTHLIQLSMDGHRKNVGIDTLDSHKCFAFCGIASPERFKDTFDSLGISCVDFQKLPDHHGYHNHEIQKLIRCATRASATCLLCTEKDLVKLAQYSFPLPLFALGMEIKPDRFLKDFILAHLP